MRPVGRDWPVVELTAEQLVVGDRIVNGNGRVRIFGLHRWDAPWGPMVTVTVGTRTVHYPADEALLVEARP